MQIVIDIDEELYNLIMRLPNQSEELSIENVMERAIYNGTPLPKKHGDLVDRDEVIDLLNEQEYNYYTELDKVVDTVYEANTIIEADREGKE